MSSSLKITIFALIIGVNGCVSDIDLDAAQTRAAEQELDDLEAEAEAIAEALEIGAPPPDGLAAPVRTDGTYYYVRAKHSDRCLHQHGAVLHNGGAITQWECIDQYNVQWRFDPAPDPGYYYIRARHSGKCVHQHGHTYGNGDRISQWDCINQRNVKWRIIPAGNNYYYIQVQHSEKCLHVHGAGWANGTPITQWSCINQPNVQWTFEPVGH